MADKTKASSVVAEDLLPSVSIVIEWENAKLSELDRAFSMLRSLSAQVRSLRARFASPPEMILIYDQDEIDPAMINSAVTNEIDAQSGLVVRLAPMEGLDYYAQKNHGASLAKGDLVVFLDSDIVPEDRWLVSLLEAAVRNPGSVVSGNTHLDTETFLGRAFGIFWFFPVRNAGNAVFRAPGFFANSVVFPRKIFSEFNFLPTGSIRGQCTVLADRLRENDIPVFRVEAARASHPAPNGFTHVVRRALCEGHDAQMLDIARNRKRLLRGGSVCLNSIECFLKCISALVMPPPGLASAH